MWWGERKETGRPRSLSIQKRDSGLDMSLPKATVWSQPLPPAGGNFLMNARTLRTSCLQFVRSAAFTVLDRLSGAKPSRGPHCACLTGTWAALGVGEGVWHWVLARWAATHCGAAKCPEAKPLRIPAAEGKESHFLSGFRGLW